MPVTSVHLFSGARHSAFRMLKSFGLLRGGLQQAPGLLFIRAMGCGRGAAFSLRPDWQRYLVMMECSSADDEARITDTPLFRHMIDASVSHRRWGLIPVRKHGAWDGEDPFTLEYDAQQKGRIAVLTRAAIAFRQIPAFIRHSYQSTKALEAAQGLIFSIGMGEYPIVRQATFSIWETDEDMKAYAYNDQIHRAAIRAKIKGSMFAEEMFVRFRLTDDP